MHKKISEMTAADKAEFLEQTKQAMSRKKKFTELKIDNIYIKETVVNILCLIINMKNTL